VSCAKSRGQSRDTHGIFTGFQDKVTLNGDEYEDLITNEAVFDNLTDLTDAIYFALNEYGIIPFAIHRCSSEDGKDGYGCGLGNVLEAIHRIQ